MSWRRRQLHVRKIIIFDHQKISMYYESYELNFKCLNYVLYSMYKSYTFVNY